jgi:alcohol dehydrogenase
VAREFAARSVLLVTDPGLVAAGHAGRVYGLLKKAGLAVVVFDRVQENPTTDCVAACLQTARLAGIEALVALGGGSAMDTAKGCNFLLTNGGDMKDYWGVGKAGQPMLPLIAIPTTAGTGSEMQSAALIADAVTHEKMACLDDKATARVAILDPVLTLSQPARVTASTGIDALAHALEAAVTRKRNAISDLCAREAFGLAMTALPEVLRNPGNLEARGQMLLAAASAGVAIENSMLGAAHAAANPLTAHYNVVHGQAVGLMLPHVIRFNAQEPAARQAYAELWADAKPRNGEWAIRRSGEWATGRGGEPESGASPVRPLADSPPRQLAAEALAQRVEWLLNMGRLPSSLREAGVEASAIPTLAAEAARQWTVGFNPRVVTEADFVALYLAAFAPRG